jgi:hypothetical protein
MNRETLLDHLAQAKEHAAKGEAHVARQREIIEELERDRHDATEAKRLLATFELTQQLHLDHIEHIEQELERADLGIRRGGL